LAFFTPLLRSLLWLAAIRFLYELVHNLEILLLPQQTEFSRKSFSFAASYFRIYENEIKLHGDSFYLLPYRSAKNGGTSEI